MGKSIKIGTRGSKLALVQAEIVKTGLKELFKDLNIELIIIKTKGDKILDSPLSQIGDKGLFIKELEEALLKKEIDMAVHSLKDMPADLPDSLVLGAVLKRGEVRDVLITNHGKFLNELTSEDTIATSSLRRKAQLLKYNPNLKIIDIRGNIDTRLKKMKLGLCDAIVLAGAGMERLGYDNEITEYLNPEIIMPAICQGIIGIEIRKDDKPILNLINSINHKETNICAYAERALLKKLQGGCQIPVGCISSIDKNKSDKNYFQITGAVFDLEGKLMVKKNLSGTSETTIETSIQLANLILQDGGNIILKDIRAGQEKQNDVNKIYLIGAGPGDEGLITVKGVECLKKSDVVVYDYLVNKELLNFCSEECEKIYVGKKANQHTKSQTEINELLVNNAKNGKIVSRLKGGDPFIFGRGGEEALELANNNIEFEIVPGVTAGVAAAAYAGIPLTHRGIASNVSFITGHEMAGKLKADINWQVLAKDTGTLVFYMGVKNLPVITSKLIEYGKSPDTPAALIRWGTLQTQETLTGKLENIAQKVQDAAFKSPALIIVGEVVGLRDKLQWFDRELDRGSDKKPLFGKKILITRSRSQASELSKQLKHLGAEVIEFPTIKIKEVSDFSLIDKLLTELNSFSRIIFTSANAVQIFFKRLLRLNLDSRSLKGIKIVVIGKGTENCILEYGIIPDLIPEKYTSEGIIQALKELKADYSNERILIPGSSISRDYLPEQLKILGAKVIKADLYDTLETEYSSEAIESVFLKLPDIVTFTSSSTVTNFVSILKKKKMNDYLNKLSGASIGPITTKTAKKLGINIKLEAVSHTIPGLVDSISEFFNKKN